MNLTSFFRGSSDKWRLNWDKLMLIMTIIPALIFGIVIGNLLTGIPFHFEQNMEINYFGDFWGLLNGFSLLLGLISISMIIMHGAVYLQLKIVTDVNKKAKTVVLIFALITLLLFSLAGYWINFLDGYHIVSEVFPNRDPDPIIKLVKREPGLWLDNYGHLPGLITLPVLAFVCGWLTIGCSLLDKPRAAFVFSSWTIIIIILTAACSMFPFVIPSNISANSSLTVWDASVSLERLNALFGVSLVVLTVIIIYTYWFFYRLTAKNDIESSLP